MPARKLQMEMTYLRRDQQRSTYIERVEQVLASNVPKLFFRQKELSFERTCMKPGYVCCAKERLDCFSGAIVH
jgi:hypothetical protein